MKPGWFLALGAASGALAAAATFAPLDEIPGIELFGYCLGMRVGSKCGGIPAGFYIFPGVIFGLAFAPLLWRHRRVRPAGALAFGVLAAIANFVAVFVCVASLDPLSNILAVDMADVPIAIAGGIGGAIGAGLLSGGAALLGAMTRPWRSIGTGCGLGFLVPLVMQWEIVGVFVFYVIWQAGYAAALARSLPSLERVGSVSA